LHAGPEIDIAYLFQIVVYNKHKIKYMAQNEKLTIYYRCTLSAWYELTQRKHGALRNNRTLSSLRDPFRIHHRAAYCQNGCPAAERIGHNMG
jgi:hypothetical protein